MTGDDQRRALHRIVAQTGVDNLVGVLAGLSGADQTTLLLEIMHRRAADMTAPDVLRRYTNDRFTAPSPLDGRRVHELSASLLATVPDDVDIIGLAPVVPLGTHSVIAPVHQDKVVSTVRGTEVAADPTNALALEAAVLRRALLAEDPRSSTVVRLAAVQRVLRAQVFGAEGALPHFTLFGLVTAGRDRGHRRFERDALAADVGVLVAGAVRAGAPRIEVRVTDLSDGRLPALDLLRTAVAGDDRVAVVDDPLRETGRGYYTDVCVKVFAGMGADLIEIGDGGFVDWTQRLLSNSKERLLISGIGVEMLATSTG